MDAASLSAQLHHAQKLESMGLLAGHVAHEFNNILSTILGYNYLLLDGLPSEHPLRGVSLEIRRIVEDAASLTGRLLRFSRRQSPAPKLLDLGAVILDSTKMLSRLLGGRIALAMDASPRLWPVRMDISQIEQILLNLLVNARDAMPRGGRISIAIRNAAVGPDLKPDPELILPAGRYVFLEIADTGTGMTEEVRQRLFEPFFTTKEPGRGTGLGLAAVQEIVRQHNGGIAVRTAPSLGTSWRIFLPAADASPEAKVPQPITGPAAPAPTSELPEP